MMSNAPWGVLLWFCLCAAQQTIAQESLMDLWWQYTNYHAQLDEGAQQEVAENLRIHLRQPKHLCSPSMSEVFDAFYVHIALLLELQEASCSTMGSGSAKESRFIEQVSDIAFLGEFMSSYLVMTPRVPTPVTSRDVNKVDGVLFSTVSFSRPMPRRGVSLDSSSQWIGSPWRQKHRLQVRGGAAELRLSLQKYPGEALGSIPWQSWIMGGLQLNLRASRLTLTLGQFSHQSPARLLSSGSSPPLSTPTYLTTLRPHRVSTTREPYRAMKGISVFSTPSPNTQIRLSLSHRSLDARSWQGDTLHAPTTSVNWTTRQGLKGRRRMTQTSLFLDGATQIGLHRVSIAWNMHFHSDWVAQRDGYLWSTSPFHGIEIGWSRRFSSQVPWQQEIVGFAAVAVHHAPRSHESPLDGIFMGGFHLTRDLFRAKVSLGWASPSWLSPVGGTLPSLDVPLQDPAPRLTSQLDFALNIESIRLDVTHSITHHYQVLGQPLKQSVKFYAQWNLPASTELHGTWSISTTHQQDWTTSLPYIITQESTQEQRASMTSHTSVGRHTIRAGGRWMASSTLWRLPSTGWFVRVHSNFQPFQTTFQWSAWTPTGSQTSISMGQPSVGGATSLISHTGHSSSLVGVLRVSQPLSKEVSLSTELRTGVQQLFNRGARGTDLDARPGVRHVWLDVHVSLRF